MSRTEKVHTHKCPGVRYAAASHRAKTKATRSAGKSEIKKMSEERILLFDQDLMSFTMGNAITIEDTNGNRKLLKKRYEQKIDNVSALMDAYVAYKLNKDAFE